MPFAEYSRFSHMIEAALEGGYAYPAVNVHDMYTLNATIEGFAKAGSDGIVQIHPNAALGVSGSIGDAALGALSLAHHGHLVSSRHDVNIAIHTDHCPPEQEDEFLQPLIRETERRRACGEPNLFTSHMFDGSSLPLEKNMIASRSLLDRCAASEIWLEIEVGVIGAESSSKPLDNADRKYTEPEEFLKIREALGDGGSGRYLVAPAFGNVHGIYKPGEVVLRPEILAECQSALVRRFGGESRFPLVFHGGSGSSAEEIGAAIANGVVKMNIDTDAQYAFTGRIADYFFSNLRKVLRIDGEVGERTAYFAETYLGRGAVGMRDYVASMCETLGSAGRSIAEG